KSFNCLEFVLYFFNQREDIFINQQDLIFGVVDDVNNVLGSQSDINRMQYGTHPRCCKVNLKMTVVIPGKCSDTIALLYTELSESAHEASRTLTNLSIC